MKTCIRCDKTKPLSEFAPQRKPNGQYVATGRCKVCRTDYERARTLKATVEKQMAGQPCMDCGGVFPFECMDYDHVRGPKVINIAHVLKRTNTPQAWEMLRAEIWKCDFVCANCHRIRTRRRTVEARERRRHAA